MQVHDEVCGMTIEADDAAASLEFLDETYYFCSERCRRMFDEHPDRFVPVPDDWETGSSPILGELR